MDDDRLLTPAGAGLWTVDCVVPQWKEEESGGIAERGKPIVAAR